MTTPATVYVVITHSQRLNKPIAGIGKISSIGIAIDFGGEINLHSMVVACNSDEVALLLAILAVLDRCQLPYPLRFLTTIKAIKERLEQAIVATPDVRKRIRTFYGHVLFEEVQKAIDLAQIEIDVISDEERDCEGFRKAHDLAHGSALREAEALVRIVPRSPTSSIAPIVLSFDGEHTFED